MKICLYYLTCANEEEAAKITSVLLEKHLATCIKKSSVTSSFLWEGKIDNGNEILLMIDSVEEYFEKIENEVKNIHNYKTFVLFSVPVSRTTKAVTKWMEDELIIT